MARFSISRFPDATPLTTLCFKPCGFPITTIGSPSFTRLESPNSSGWKIIRLHAQHGPSPLPDPRHEPRPLCLQPFPIRPTCTEIGRPSPITCWLVAINPSLETTNPVPNPCCLPSRPTAVMISSTEVTSGPLRQLLDGKPLLGSLFRNQRNPATDHHPAKERKLRKTTHVSLNSEVVRKPLFSRSPGFPTRPCSPGYYNASRLSEVFPPTNSAHLSPPSSQNHKS